MTHASLIASENAYQPLSTVEARRIAIMADDVARNLEITRGYHRLKLGMANLIGAENLSWCAYASWSSHSVGSFIRGEVVPAPLRALSTAVSSLVKKSTDLVRRVLGREPATDASETFMSRVLGQVSTILADANRMVWADIGPIFASFIETFETATRYDAAAYERFAATLRQGSVEDGGQSLLISAFRNYHVAMFTADAKRKAELILMANAQIGYHEQARLQPFIKSALEAPIALLMDAGPRKFAHRLGFGRLWNKIDAWTRRVWVGLSTRFFMYLELPDANLSVGKDLPSINGENMFPEALRDIEDAELRTLLEEIDFTPDSTSGSAAKNWADFSERMNFIIDLFRTRQQDTRLYSAPFAQAA